VLKRQLLQKLHLKKLLQLLKNLKLHQKPQQKRTNLNSDEPELTKLNSKYIYIAIIILALYNLWEYRLSIQRFLMKPILKRELKNEI
jgi:hypothetical protein